MRYSHSLSRGNLIIELDIGDPNWEISNDGEVDSRRSDNRNPSGQGVENLAIINSELDLDIEYLLRGLSSWDQMDIILSQRTRKNRYWKKSTTMLLENSLGPNLSKNKRRLTFRPHYFYRLSRIRNSGFIKGGFNWVCEFMRNRENLSKNPGAGSR